MTEFFARHVAWLVPLAAIGVAAIISAIITLFFGLQKPARMALIARPAVGRRRS
jgi:hypothetical protein